MTQPPISERYDLRKRVPPVEAFDTDSARRVLASVRTGRDHRGDHFEAGGLQSAPIWDGHRRWPERRRHVDLLCSPDPRTRRWGQAAMLHDRQVQWRNARLNATIGQLDPKTDDAHARWYAALRLHLEWATRHAEHHGQIHIFDIATPYTTPSGIPSPDPDPSDLPHVGAELAPEFPTLWDVEMAAQLEIEEHIGSARINYQAIWNTMGMTEYAAKLRTIGKYHLFHNRSIPKHPYDTLIWGHNRRLKKLVIISNRDKVRLYPDFSPDVTEYVARTPVAPIPEGSVEFETEDSLLATSAYKYTGIAQGYTGVVVTVTDAFGKTQDYTVRVQ